MATMLVMGIVAVISLFCLSLLTYYWKWNADKAEIGIILTYILAGFFGGRFLKRCWKRKQEHTEISISHGQKIMDAVLLGTVFVVILVFLSMLSCGSAFSVSTRLFVVWFLVMGSACLGRI